MAKLEQQNKIEFEPLTFSEAGKIAQQLLLKKPETHHISAQGFHWEEPYITRDGDFCTIVIKEEFQEGDSWEATWWSPDKTTKDSVTIPNSELDAIISKLLPGQAANLSGEFVKRHIYLERNGLGSWENSNDDELTTAPFTITVYINEELNEATLLIAEK